MTHVYADYLYDESKYKEAAIGKIPLIFPAPTHYIFRRISNAMNFSL